MTLDKLIERADHWHRAEFAARCAEIVFPIFDRAWPDALPARRQIVEQTIEMTLVGARTRSVPENHASVTLECRVTAGIALRPLHPNAPFPLTEPAPPKDLCRLAHGVVSSAAWAADSLPPDREMAVQAASEAFIFSHIVTEHAPDFEANQKICNLVEEFFGNNA